MRWLRLPALLALCIPPAASGHDVPRRAVPTGRNDYIAMVRTAAPLAVVETATILMPDGKGATIVVQQGTNGFTCDITPAGTPKCADAAAMAWLKAIRSGTRAPEDTGIIYMLAEAAEAAPHHHDAGGDHEHFVWAESGPHIMVVGRGARARETFDFEFVNADPARASLMYPGTKYEHLMIPVAPSPHTH